MRIQFLSSSSQLGGAEICLLDMIAGLKEAYSDWSISAVLPQQGPLFEKLTQLGVQTEILPFPPELSSLGDCKPAHGRVGSLLLGANLATSFWPTLSYCHKLARSIHSFAPDLLHSNGMKMSVLGARAKDPHLPMIWHLHDYVSARPLMRRALRAYAHKSATMLVNSNSVRDDLCACLKNGSSVQTFYNTVDVARFAPEGPKADLDALSGMAAPAAPALRVGLIATMAWWKGHKDFIRALALLSPGEHVRGYVIGGPIYETEASQIDRDELRTLSAELNLQDRVGFTGFVEEPSSAIRALDVVIHASTAPEPFGRVIMEAMSCGRPVITTAMGGAAELVKPEENALHFRPGDPADLARRIRQLAQNVPLRRRLGEAGRNTVLQRFDRQHSGPRLAGLYQKILSRTA